VLKGSKFGVKLAVFGGFFLADCTAASLSGPEY